MLGTVGIGIGAAGIAAAAALLINKVLDDRKKKEKEFGGYARTLI